MVKKVFVGVLIAAVFGLLVFGAVNRTMAKALDAEPLLQQENVAAGYGGGNGNGNSQTYQNQVLDGGRDDCIGDGEAYGTGTGYGAGYAAGNEVPPQDGTGYGFGIGTSDSAYGKGVGGQPEDAPADGTGDGIADVDEWLTYDATVNSTDSLLWVVTLEDGTVIEIDGRTLSYVTDLGFTVNPGDSLVIVGFFEDGIFEVGQIENLTSGDSVVIRDEDGTPLWAGGLNTTQNGGHHGGRNN